MASTLICAIDVLLGSTWVNIASDGVSTDRLSIRYGISGNKPTDVLADTGECRFTLRNSSRNSGGLQGYYSPLHANVRSGWTHGDRVRVSFTNGATEAITSITRSGGTATVTTGATLQTGWYLRIAGANQAEYNGVFPITVTGAGTFTYAVSGTPASPATGTITLIRAFIKFHGKIDTIDPEPGQYLTQQVHVTAYDYMRDLHEAQVINVALQVNEREDTVIGAALDSLPSTNQPLARSLDAGLDILAYAFDDLGSGATGAAVLQDIILSSYGLGVMTGDGTFRYISRNTRATTSSSYTIANTMRGLRAPSSRANVYNLVRTTNHPKSIDTSDVVLYALSGTAPAVPTGDTITIEGRFRDPDDVRRAIGAASTVALASGTDYAGNSAADGSGSSLTADLSITATVDASRVVFEIENTGGTPIYLVNGSGDTTLQIRGKGIYDNAPRTFETSSGDADRLIEIDLPYSDDDGTTQQIGTLIRSQYEDLAAQIDAIDLRALTDAQILQALEREPGDVLTVTETMTGLSAVESMILSCAYDLGPENRLSVSWGMGPVIDVNPPNPPTGFTVSIVSDVETLLSWTTGSGASGAVTLIYRDDMHIGTAAPGVTAWSNPSLTPATTYVYTLRHMENALISDPTADVSARPVVAATGGDSIYTSSGYKYHEFTSSGTFAITTEGHIDFALVGGGGGAAAGGANGGSDAGGGGGGGGRLVWINNNQEPAGSYAVTIGAGGPGGVYDAITPYGYPGTVGSDTTYRGNTAIGGGYGGNVDTANGVAGGAGGNGGGGGGGATGGAAGSVTGSPGNAGGAGYSAGAGNAAGGGGGGGHVSAGSTNTTTGGNGGAGQSLWSGGPSGDMSAGGHGGRGVSAANGTANRGEGGSAGAPTDTGGDGGSGFAVFRYPV